MIALELAIKIFVGIALGFLLYKIDILNEKVNAGISRLLVEVACPFMIFANIISISGQNVADKHDVYYVLLVGVVIYAILVPFSFVVVRLLRPKKISEGVFQCLLLFGNVGFIGIPVSEAFFGPVGVFFMALLNIHFNVLCYTYGLWLVTKDADTEYKFSTKRLFNPAIISIIVALVLFLFDIKFPEVVVSPISFIGNITSPLSLLVLGGSIAAYNLKEIFSEWRIYIFTFIRMIIFPIATFFIMKAIFGPGLITNVTTLYMGTPAALITGMFAMAYGGDTKGATGGLAMMNILCIITIPGIYLMTQYM